MAENIPGLRDAVADAEQQVGTAEAELRKAVETWRAEFGAALEPAMLAQARLYFERFPVEAKSLDASGVTRLRGEVRGAAADVSKRTTGQITFETACETRRLSNFRRDLLAEVAKAMEDSLRPTFPRAHWLVTHQTAPMPQADLSGFEEPEAYRSVDKASEQLVEARSLLEGLQRRLDRAEALALWDGSED